MTVAHFSLAACVVVILSVLIGLRTRRKVSLLHAAPAACLCGALLYVLFSLTFVASTTVAFKDAPRVFIPFFFLPGGEFAEDISKAPSRVEFVNKYGPDLVREKLPATANVTTNGLLTLALLSSVVFLTTFLLTIAGKLLLLSTTEAELIPRSREFSLPRVFISYSSRDTKFAKWLATRLKAEGLDVWIDVQRIAVGDSIVHRLNEGLGSASYLIAILSESSVNSKWVRDELDYAFFKEKTKQPVTILPVVIDECILPPLLMGRKFADCRTNKEQGLKELLAVLNRERAILNSDFSDFSRAETRPETGPSLADLGRNLIQLAPDQLNQVAQALLSNKSPQGDLGQPDELVDEILRIVEDRKLLSKLRDLLADESPGSLPKSMRPLASQLTEEIEESGLELKDLIFMNSLSEHLHGANSRRWRLLRTNSAYDFSKLKKACDRADSKLCEADNAFGQYHQTMLFLQAIYLFAVPWSEMTVTSMTNEQFFVELIDDLARSVIKLQSPIDSSNVGTFLSHCKSQAFAQALQSVGFDPSLFENL